MIAAFVVYIIKSVYSDDVTLTDKKMENTFVSSYKKVGEIPIGDTIITFEATSNRIATLTAKELKLFNLNGTVENSFGTKSGIRDMILDNDRIYFLHPTFIDVVSLQGDSLFSWNACSDLSDYCSFAKTGNFIYVTDAANKNICQYTAEGNFVRFIQSPRGFVTPSHAFDITTFNDTIYCVNPGRHLIETYTLNGEFISAFGGPGTEDGFFSGCCNPVFIHINNHGSIFTSEKGVPRISRYNSKGNFQELILNHRLLGGGNKAHEIKVANNNLWVANLDKIEIYESKKE